MEHPFLMFLDHTQRRSTVGRLITRPEESYRLCCVVVCDLETSRMGAPYIYDISHLRVNVSMVDEIEEDEMGWAGGAHGTRTGE